jgi:hypothetical protein
VKHGIDGKGNKMLVKYSNRVLLLKLRPMIDIMSPHHRHRQLLAYVLVYKPSIFWISCTTTRNYQSWDLHDDSIDYNLSEIDFVLEILT